uniref:4Fe-4S ferredoxin-type domain-containing protein n=1 Tax=Ascaris lumbricoides TaxID=6252 RepID=A0A0M3IFX7_ASCLU
MVMMEVERLVKPVERCAKCGLLVKDVRLAYSDAVRTLEWEECTDDCGIAMWPLSHV